MIANFQVFLVLILLTQVIYWSVSINFPQWRLRWLILSSIFLLLSVSPGALLAAGIMTLFTFGAVRCVYRRSMKVKRTTLAITISLLVVFLYWWSWDEAISLQSIGLSYVLLKLIILVREDLLEPSSQPLSLENAVLSMVFFPIYSAGPIQPPRTLASEMFAISFDLSQYLNGWGRIVVGVFKLYFIAGTIINPYMNSVISPENVAQGELSCSEAWLYVFLKFLTLYLNFSGYTDIAVGSGRTLGINILENFNWPLRATNIQEFWTRWHMSLAAFIRNHLFIPFARLLGGRMHTATILSFVIVGLWHHISLPYLMWGLGHGTALVVYSRYASWAKRQTLLAQFRYTLPWRIGGLICTVAYVSVLSTFANTGSVNESFTLLMSLV